MRLEVLKCAYEGQNKNKKFCKKFFLYTEYNVELTSVEKVKTNLLQKQVKPKTFMINKRQ
jgi:hypothetical protein